MTPRPETSDIVSSTAPKVRIAWMAPVVAMVGVLESCRQHGSTEKAPPVSSESVLEALSAAPPTEPSDAAAPTSEPRLQVEAELRRGYGVVDMRFNSCVTMLNDHTVAGVGCPPGVVIYGPYVSVPANSEIEISFEVKPSQRLEIYADIVSRMGAQTLAALSPQVVEAGVNQKLGYRLHVFDADTNVESRIGTTSGTRTDFQITNLTMVVR